MLRSTNFCMVVSVAVLVVAAVNLVVAQTCSCQYTSSSLSISCSAGYSGSCVCPLSSSGLSPCPATTTLKLSAFNFTDTCISNAPKDAVWTQPLPFVPCVGSCGSSVGGTLSYVVSLTRSASNKTCAWTTFRQDCIDANTCDPTVCILSPWSDWSACSVTCGSNGLRTRSRVAWRGPCTNTSALSQTAPCELTLPPCVLPDWITLMPRHCRLNEVPRASFSYKWVTPYFQAIQSDNSSFTSYLDVPFSNYGYEPSCYNADESSGSPFWRYCNASESAIMPCTSPPESFCYNVNGTLACWNYPIAGARDHDLSNSELYTEVDNRQRDCTLEEQLQYFGYPTLLCTKYLYSKPGHGDVPRSQYTSPYLELWLGSNRMPRFTQTDVLTIPAIPIDRTAPLVFNFQDPNYKTFAPLIQNVSQLWWGGMPYVHVSITKNQGVVHYPTGGSIDYSGGSSESRRLDVSFVRNGTQLYSRWCTADERFDYACVLDPFGCRVFCDDANFTIGCEYWGACLNETQWSYYQSNFFFLSSWLHGGGQPPTFPVPAWPYAFPVQYYLPPFKGWTWTGADHSTSPLIPFSWSRLPHIYPYGPCISNVGQFTHVTSCAPPNDGITFNVVPKSLRQDRSCPADAPSYFQNTTEVDQCNAWQPIYESAFHLPAIGLDTRAVVPFSDWTALLPLFSDDLWDTSGCHQTNCRCDEFRGTTACEKGATVSCALACNAIDQKQAQFNLVNTRTKATDGYYWPLTHFPAPTFGNYTPFCWKNAAGHIYAKPAVGNGRNQRGDFKLLNGTVLKQPDCVSINPDGSLNCPGEKSFMYPDPTTFCSVDVFTRYFPGTDPLLINLCHLTCPNVTTCHIYYQGVPVPDAWNGTCSEAEWLNVSCATNQTACQKLCTDVLQTNCYLRYLCPWSPNQYIYDNKAPNIFDCTTNESVSYCGPQWSIDPFRVGCQKTNCAWRPRTQTFDLNSCTAIPGSCYCPTKLPNATFPCAFPEQIRPCVAANETIRACGTHGFSCQLNCSGPQYLQCNLIPGTCTCQSPAYGPFGGLDCNGVQHSCTVFENQTGVGGSLIQTCSSNTPYANVSFPRELHYTCWPGAYQPASGGCYLPLNNASVLRNCTANQTIASCGPGNVTQCLTYLGTVLQPQTCKCGNGSFTYVDPETGYNVCATGTWVLRNCSISQAHSCTRCVAFDPLNPNLCTNGTQCVANCSSTTESCVILSQTCLTNSRIDFCPETDRIRRCGPDSRCTQQATWNALDGIVAVNTSSFKCVCNDKNFTSPDPAWEYGIQCPSFQNFTQNCSPARTNLLCGVLPSVVTPTDTIADTFLLVNNSIWDPRYCRYYANQPFNPVVAGTCPGSFSVRNCTATEFYEWCPLPTHIACEAACLLAQPTSCMRYGECFETRNCTQTEAIAACGYYATGCIVSGGVTETVVLESCTFSCEAGIPCNFSRVPIAANATQCDLTRFLAYCGYPHQVATCNSIDLNTMNCTCAGDRGSPVPWRPKQAPNQALTYASETFYPKCSGRARACKTNNEVVHYAGPLATGCYVYCDLIHLADCGLANWTCAPFAVPDVVFDLFLPSLNRTDMVWKPCARNWQVAANISVAIEPHLPLYCGDGVAQASVNYTNGTFISSASDCVCLPGWFPGIAFACQYPYYTRSCTADENAVVPLEWIQQCNYVCQLLCYPAIAGVRPEVCFAHSSNVCTEYLNVSRPCPFVDWCGAGFSANCSAIAPLRSDLTFSQQGSAATSLLTCGCKWGAIASTCVPNKVNLVPCANGVEAKQACGAFATGCFKQVAVLPNGQVYSPSPPVLDHCVCQPGFGLGLSSDTNTTCGTQYAGDTCDLERSCGVFTQTVSRVCSDDLLDCVTVCHCLPGTFDLASVPCNGYQRDCTAYELQYCYAASGNQHLASACSVQCTYDDAYCQLSNVSSCVWLPDTRACTTAEAQATCRGSGGAQCLFSNVLQKAIIASCGCNTASDVWNGTQCIPFSTTFRSCTHDEMASCGTYNVYGCRIRQVRFPMSVTLLQQFFTANEATDALNFYSKIAGTSLLSFQGGAYLQNDGSPFYRDIRECLCQAPPTSTNARPLWMTRFQNWRASNDMMQYLASLAYNVQGTLQGFTPAQLDDLSTCDVNFQSQSAQWGQCPLNTVNHVCNGMGQCPLKRTPINYWDCSQESASLQQCWDAYNWETLPAGTLSNYHIPVPVKTYPNFPMVAAQLPASTQPVGVSPGLLDPVACTPITAPGTDLYLYPYFTATGKIIGELYKRGDVWFFPNGTLVPFSVFADCDSHPMLSSQEMYSYATAINSVYNKLQADATSLNKFDIVTDLTIAYGFGTTKEFQDVRQALDPSLGGLTYNPFQNIPAAQVDLFSQATAYVQTSLTNDPNYQAFLTKVKALAIPFNNPFIDATASVLAHAIVGDLHIVTPYLQAFGVKTCDQYRIQYLSCSISTASSNQDCYASYSAIYQNTYNPSTFSQAAYNIECVNRTCQNCVVGQWRGPKCMQRDCTTGISASDPQCLGFSGLCQGDAFFNASYVADPTSCCYHQLLDSNQPECNLPVGWDGRVGCIHGTFDWFASQCVCDPGWQRDAPNGMACTSAVCPQQCSGTGTCLANTTCVCNPTYHGTACQLNESFAISVFQTGHQGTGCSIHGHYVFTVVNDHTLTATCVCSSAQWTDATCSTPSRVCLNGGQAIWSPITVDPDRVTCSCPIPYGGSSCELNLCPRSAGGLVCNGFTQCTNTSDCRAFIQGAYLCPNPCDLTTSSSDAFCPLTRYQGCACEADTFLYCRQPGTDSLCSGVLAPDVEGFVTRQPCQPFLNTTTLGIQYHCVCPPERTGSYCEISKCPIIAPATLPCNGETCVHNGTCICETLNKAVGDRLRVGTNCEHDVTDSCGYHAPGTSILLMCSGQGQCITNNNVNFFCSCNFGYTGAQCQTSACSQPCVWGTCAALPGGLSSTCSCTHPEVYTKPSQLAPCIRDVCNEPYARPSLDGTQCICNDTSLLPPLCVDPACPRTPELCGPTMPGDVIDLSSRFFSGGVHETQQKHCVGGKCVCGWMYSTDVLNNVCVPRCNPATTVLALEQLVNGVSRPRVNGVPVDLFASCVCAPGWTGPACTVSVCKNSGTLFPGSNLCNCSSALVWVGPTCEQSVCGARGVASDDQTECLCRAPFTGRFCQSIIDPTWCTDANHGSVNDDGTCACTFPFTGSKCAANLCDARFTANVSATQGCICVKGFSGPTCDSAVCLNGGSFNVASGRCSCAADYTGTSCETRVCGLYGVVVPRLGVCLCSGLWSGTHCDTQPCGALGTPLGSTLACNCTYPSAPSPLACVLPCRNGTWNAASGTCVCKAATYGVLCDRSTLVAVVTANPSLVVPLIPTGVNTTTNVSIATTPPSHQDQPTIPPPPSAPPPHTVHTSSGARLGTWDLIYVLALMWAVMILLMQDGDATHAWFLLLG